MHGKGEYAMLSILFEPWIYQMKEVVSRNVLSAWESYMIKKLFDNNI